MEEFFNMFPKRTQEEIEADFQLTLERCDKEIDELVKHIDGISDVVEVIRDKVDYIAYRALRSTIISLVAEGMGMSTEIIDKDCE